MKNVVFQGTSSYYHSLRLPNSMCSLLPFPFATFFSAIHRFSSNCYFACVNLGNLTWGSDISITQRLQHAIPKSQFSQMWWVFFSVSNILSELSDIYKKTCLNSQFIEHKFLLFIFYSVSIQKLHMMLYYLLQYMTLIKISE